MATYVYETIPKKGRKPKQFEYIQSMKDAPLTKHPKTGEPVRRVLTGGLGFRMSGDKIDPFSQKQFRERTDKKGDTLGALWDRSKEWSQMRAEKSGGEDPIEQKYFADYRKRKRGTPHTVELAKNQKKAKEHLDKGLEKLGMTIKTKFSNT